jgi:hypothetical protein
VSRLGSLTIRNFLSQWCDRRGEYGKNLRAERLKTKSEVQGQEGE